MYSMQIYIWFTPGAGGGRYFFQYFFLLVLFKCNVTDFFIKLENNLHPLHFFIGIQSDLISDWDVQTEDFCLACVISNISNTLEFCLFLDPILSVSKPTDFKISQILFVCFISLSVQTTKFKVPLFSHNHATMYHDRMHSRIRILIQKLDASILTPIYHTKGFSDSWQSVTSIRQRVRKNTERTERVFQPQIYEIIRDTAGRIFHWWENESLKKRRKSMKQHQTVKRLFQQIWDWDDVQFMCPICFWVFCPLLFLAQDINHYSSKTKILATSAQNFCNENKEIQTNLFWGYKLASWKEKFKTKRKRLGKNCTTCFIFDVKKSSRGSDMCLFNKWL